MVLCSSRTGQAALQPLPSLSDKKAFQTVDIAAYPLPDNAVQQPTPQHSKNSNNNSNETWESGSVKTTISSKSQRLSTPRRLSALLSPRTPKRGAQSPGFSSPRRNSPASSKSSHHSSATPPLSQAEGIAVWKVNKNGKLQARRLAFSQDRRSLLVTTSRIKSIRGLFKAARGSTGTDTKTVLLSRVDRIQKGLHTARFRRVLTVTQDSGPNNNRNNNNSNQNNINSPELIRQLLQKQDQQPMAISIIHELEGEGRFEALDLVIPNHFDYSNLVQTLEGLLDLHELERNSKTGELQLLQYHWLEMNLPLAGCLLNSNQNQDVSAAAEKGYVTQSDFLQLVERLDFMEAVGKSQLTALFQQHCQGLVRRNLNNGQLNNNGSNHSSGSNSKSEQVLLTFVETAALLEKARALQNLSEEDPLEQIWNQMVASDPVQAINVNDNPSSHAYELHVMTEGEGANGEEEESISTSAFLSFLRSQQREYSVTLDQATELVNALNLLCTARSRPGSGYYYRSRTRSSALQQQTPPASPHTPTRRAIAPDDRLTKSRFMDFMVSDFNDALAMPGRCTDPTDPPMDMTRPLSQYYIATSHSSFLAIPTHQAGGSAWNANGSSSELLSDEAQVDSIYTALFRGVRCLELTVWDGPSQLMEPVVSLTGTEENGSSVRLRNCLTAIAYFLEQEPYTFPILLKIENHCSTNVQSVLAQQLRETLGAPGLLLEPQLSVQDPSFVLPSPESARGKVIVLGKRPRDLVFNTTSTMQQQPARVMNDDYDANNDAVIDLNRSPSQITYFDDEEERGENQGVVVGFNAEGPIYSLDIHAVAHTPQHLWQKAEKDRVEAQQVAAETKAAAVDLEAKARRMEEEALEKQKIGNPVLENFKSPQQLLNRKRQSQRNNQLSPASSSLEEEKSLKDDEGVEVHEVLTDIVEASEQEYAEAANEAMEAAKHVIHHRNALNEAERRLQAAHQEVQKSKDHVNALVQASQSARLKATANHEHADAAQARLERVRDLLRNSGEASTSAETVVVTALTEAKISEKRATDAESRASRAAANAAKDRAKSDEETRKEEEMELRVTNLMTACKKASQAVKEGRERVERSTAALERVTEQIRLIESNPDYRRDLTQSESSFSHSPTQQDSASLADKREAKAAERERLVQKTNDSVIALKSAEVEKARFQREFEELNQMLRLQTELSSKMRKVADRSAHAAEELAEHAEEEREAANLRHVARERAEANVQRRGTYKESLQTQYQEAQRAASEAAALADESRKYADKLEKELETGRDFHSLLQTVEEREWARNEAKSYYDYAVSDKKQKDAKMMKCKHLVEVSDEVRQNAHRNLSLEDRSRQSTKSNQQLAVTAYNEATVLRQQADAAEQEAQTAAALADEKARIARRALEYRDKMSLVVKIPPSLAAQTLLHSLRFYHWERSLGLSNAHYHSLACTVLQKIPESGPGVTAQQRHHFHRFTQNHLCRIHPSQGDSKPHKNNFSPILAWSLGAQLVSMNYSRPDEHLLVAEGLFRQNSSCGYVLKPQQLSSAPPRALDEQRLTIKILGAYRLPKLLNSSGSGGVASGSGHHRRLMSGASASLSSSNSFSTIKPVVRVTLHSGENDEAPQFVFETRQSRRSGTDPVLFTHDNHCTLDAVKEGTAMVTFTVWDTSKSNNYIGGAAIPMSCLREGYRSVALFDAHHSRAGPYKFASILVHITKRVH